MMPTGKHCKSPAMRHSVWCYYHDRLHRGFNTKRPAKAAIKFPVLDNARSIQTALTDVMNALASGKLDPRRSGRMIYALSIAANNFRRASAVCPPAKNTAPAKPRPDPIPRPRPTSAAVVSQGASNSADLTSC